MPRLQAAHAPLKGVTQTADAVAMSIMSITSPVPRRPQRQHGDRGDILLGWLAKLVVVFGVVGVVVFDAISVVSARATVHDDGTYAARAAATVWVTTGDVDAAYRTAVAAAAEKHADNRVDVGGFRIEPDGVVYLTIRRTASTLLVDRLDQTAKWARITEDVTGRDGTY